MRRLFPLDPERAQALTALAREITEREPLDPPAVLRLRVDLVDAEPPIWRSLDVRGDLTLEEVHNIVQAAFGWTDSHLHTFWLGRTRDDRLRTVGAWADEGELDETELREVDVRLDQVLRRRGNKAGYRYDFGDSWDHTLKVEKVLPLRDDAPPAVCVDGRGCGPLEDIGGIWSHNELAELIRQAPDYQLVPEQYREWLEPGYDPDAFSVNETNRRLAVVGKSPDDLLQAALEELRGPAGDVAAIEFHPAVRHLVERLEPSVGAALLESLVAAPGSVPEETLATVMRPYTLLLEIAGEDGIPLSAAGWMKPVIVARIFGELDLDEEWLGKGNREDLTPEVALIREGVVKAGLLRKVKGKLLRTKAGQACMGDPARLWSHLAGRIGALDNGWAGQANVTFLYACAAGSRHPDRTAADLLASIGWRTESPLNAMRERLGLESPAVWPRSVAEAVEVAHLVVRSIRGQPLLRHLRVTDSADGARQHGTPEATERLVARALAGRTQQDWDAEFDRTSTIVAAFARAAYVREGS
ncbi:MAG: plasmid pRiA4b ORF-3 family protein [Tetrasphaera sp.]